MKGNKIIYVIQPSLVYDGQGTAESFFCRLENQADFAALDAVCILHQLLCDTKTHGSMGVMAAGMHCTRIYGSKAFVIRTESFLLRFIIRQAVNVEAECGYRTCFWCCKFCDHPRNPLCLLYEHRIGALGNGPFLQHCNLCFVRTNQADNAFCFHHIRSHDAGISHTRQNFCNSGTGTDFPPSVFRIFMELSSIFCVFAH